MKICILESDGWNSSKINREKVSELVKEYSEIAEKILGDVSENLNIIVKPNLPHVSNVKGIGGSTFDHELIDITFDPSLPFGLEKFKRYLKEAIFHEMNHALYMKHNPRENRQLYWTVLEGLGINFDSEYAEGKHFEKGEASQGEKLNWLVKYSDDSVYYWDTPNDGMMYQVGSWIVSSAIKNSGKDIVEISKLSCDKILALSNIKSD